MAHLNGIARDHGEFVAGDAAAGIARRSVERMRPDAVAAHVGDAAIENLEIGGAFFKQNSAGGVVALLCVQAAAVGDLDVVDPDRMARIDQDREAGDPDRFDLRDFEIRDALGKDSVVRREAREHGFRRRKADRPAQRRRGCHRAKGRGS